MSREGDLIHTATFTHAKIGRVDQPITMEVRQSTTEKVDGTPVSFSSTVNAATMSTKTRGNIENGKVTIVSSQFGMEQRQTFDFDPTGLMTWGMFRESVVQGFEPDTTYALKAFAPDLRLDAPVDVKVVVGDWEDYEYKGTQRGLKVVTTMGTPMGEFALTSWVDKAGIPQRSIIPMPGMGNLEVFAVDQEKALADFVPPEMFMTSTVAARTRIDRAKVNEIEYRISTKVKGHELGEFPITGMQHLKSGDPGKINLVVRRQKHQKTAQVAATLSPTELEEYTGSNLMMNIKDPDLIAIARKGAGGETDPYKLADNLRKFVTDYISDKSLDVGFATASEVCRRKEGDCSEHGVLLAALGRICGLPSRVVVGLAYVPLFGRQQDIFGYHMWTQFYIDGRWVDVDAALEETECSPARIAMAVSSLKNAGMADLSLPMLKKIGAIEVEVVKIDGKSVGRSAGD
ncbi:MAG: transglutaminase-like domain-containing protein [Planctomycetota bacterium]